MKKEEKKDEGITLITVLNAINETKKDLINDEQSEKEYNKLAFVVNRGLSQFIDTVLYANEMNQHHTVDGKLAFDYYKYTIRKRQRRGKWAKKSASEDIDAVMEYYGYNRKKAESALTILSPENLEIIRTRLEKGGR